MNLAYYESERVKNYECYKNKSICYVHAIK